MVAPEAGPRVALVLGAAVWSTGPSPALRRRAEAAAAAWHRGEVDHLIGCGGEAGAGPSEAEAIRDILLASGVPSGAILMEDRSTTTEENIRLALPLVKGLGTDRVVLVSDPVHLPRARLIARRAGLTVAGAIAAARPRGFSRRRLLFRLRETGAYLLYVLRLR